VADLDTIAAGAPLTIGTHPPTPATSAS